MSKHMVNPEAQAMAMIAFSDYMQKRGFVPAGGAPPGAGGPPSMDPAAGGPPMDPSMMGDPNAGAPPVDPNTAMAPTTPPPPPAPQPSTMVEPIKPKIDVNVEIMLIKKMLAKLCDQAGVHIPAADMAVNSQDLTQMAMGQQAQPAPSSAISPIAPIQPAMPKAGADGAGRGYAYGEQQATASDHALYAHENGMPLNGEKLGSVSNHAAAVLAVLAARRSN